MARRFPFITTVLIALMAAGFSPPARGADREEADRKEQDSPLKKVQWKKGPCIGDLGTMAEVRVPAGFVFAGAGDMKSVMEAMENISSGDEVGFLWNPASDIALIFEFDGIGYVKDDEKGSLDADGMLKSIRAESERANEERKKRGWSRLQVVGWEIPPCYDAATHNLAWAIRGRSEDGGDVVDSNIRLLGRDGVMKVTLISAPQKLQEAAPVFQQVLSGFSYKSGRRYAEYRQGDKIAKYGLAALVVGGATAAASKSGPLKGLWTIIAAAAAGAGIFLKKLFGKRTTRRGAPEGVP